SMGPLVKVVLKGQPVFLCCKGCEDEARANPDKTLAEVERLKKAGAKPPAPPPPGPAETLATGKANAARPSAADRRRAQAQKYCAVQRDELLGSMGKPVKLTLKGQPVFLCCASCEGEAKESPDKALADVEKLKAKAAAEARGKGGRP